MTKQRLVELVLEGKLDSVLEDLTEACTMRRRVLHEAKARKLLLRAKPGTHVEVIGNIRPKYLIGQRGVVEEPPQWAKRHYKPIVYVRFEQRIGKYGHVVGIPAGSLKILKPVTR